MKLPKIKLNRNLFLRSTFYVLFLILSGAVMYLTGLIFAEKINAKIAYTNLFIELGKARGESLALKNEDQYKKNQKLQAEITAINKTYSDSISSYEKVTDLKALGVKTEKEDMSYAKIVRYLADKNYASASSTLLDLNKQISEDTPKIVTATQTVTVNAKESNDLPGEGYGRQTVKTDAGSFVVDIIAANLNTTKVIIDTASDSDCGNDCPVKSVADYASRSGAWAAINGNFFCPQDYPSCSGKVNSFDTLVMNKAKHYFNSDNNVYSSIPVVSFTSGSARFMSKSSEWGRDTGVDGVIANYPLLVQGGNVAFTENPNEPKFGAKGARTFVGNKGNMIYIGVIRNATMGESAQVLKALNMENAMNLDEGGSTALWYEGKYLVGPGRNIPNAVLFVKR